MGHYSALQLSHHAVLAGVFPLRWWKASLYLPGLVAGRISLLHRRALHHRHPKPEGTNILSKKTGAHIRFSGLPHENRREGKGLPLIAYIFVILCGGAAKK